MTNPREHEHRSRSRASSGWGKTRNTKPWRPGAAFVAAAAILLPGALLVAGELAWARGGVWQPPAMEIATPDVATTPTEDVQTHHKRDATRPNGLAVCVRLCDGFFFPSATSSGGDEACAVQCPDAPTARYTEPAGSDRIEEALSTRGALYTALPVANRYQTAFDNTCRCHRSLTPDYSASLLNDPTLRKGDVVMTSKGLVVFQGANTRTITSADFVALSQARSLPNGLRAALVALAPAGASQPRAGAAKSPSAAQRQSRVLPPLASAVSAR